MRIDWRISAPALTLVAIHVATLFGDFVAPHSATRQMRALPWAPPSKLHFIDPNGRFHFRPFTHPLQVDPSGSTTYIEDRTKLCHLRLFVKGDKYRLAGFFPTELHLIGTDSPCSLYLLGTDSVGRDLLARTLLGGRISLLTGLLAAALALAFGSLLGALAGYFGGSTDELLMTVAELFLALPWLYLLLGLRAFLPLTLQPTESFFLIVGAIGLIGWAKPARLVRSALLTERKRAFIQAAIGYGASHSTILFRHLAPSLSHLLATQVGILIPSFILAEVTLSFLGLGIAEPIPSWGTLLAELQSYHVLSNHPILLLPALLLVVTTLSYYALVHRRHA